MNYKNKINLVSCNKIVFAFIFFTILSCKEKKTDVTAVLNDEAPIEEKGFVDIFDGKTLNNWKGDPNYWSVENGCLVGKVTPETLLKSNTFIVWQGGNPSDFELKLEFKITEDGNSGINYRSDEFNNNPFALTGYQADIDGKNRYTGQNYEEKKRTTLAYRGEKVIITSQENPEDPKSLKANVKKNAWQSRSVIESIGNIDSLGVQIKKNEWNTCHLIVKGNVLKHYINDILMSEVIDNDEVNRTAGGKLGVQVHVGPPMQVEYKNITLKTL